MIQIDKTRYEFEQQSSNFEKRLVLQCSAMQCNDFCLYYRKIVAKKVVFIFQHLYYTINTKKLCLSYRFINKKCHDMIPSDCEQKSCLSFTIKHYFFSELFRTF